MMTRYSSVESGEGRGRGQEQGQGGKTAGVLVGAGAETEGHPGGFVLILRRKMRILTMMMSMIGTIISMVTSSMS